MKSKIYLLLFGVAFNACTKHTETLKLGEDLTIQFGETLTSEDLGISLTLDSVINDSRCPKQPLEILCAWEGDAEAHLSFKLNTSGHKLQLHTYLHPKFEYIQPYKITLVDVKPEPQADIKIPASEYKCIVRVDK